ncbi:hypothetical protein D3C72_1820950 [compost metagenome]
MFARRAAAEVLARQQNRSALVARLVEHELGVQRAAAVVLARLAMIEVAPFVEQVGAETAAVDRLQELLRNNRVGVDVGAVQRGDQAFVNRKFIHAVSTR